MATLDFKGKALVQNYHLSVKYHELVPKRDRSLTDKVRLDDNLIIHGDNLKALKALLPTYAGKVKCIYIDPPYNTGNEGWAYNDNVNSPMMKEWLGKAVDRDDLTRHDKWLCMMLPRLKLLKDLLRNDGVIFVSIDDNEVQYLRLLMEEIFGQENFIAQMVWHNSSRSNDYITTEHEYLVVFARDLSALGEPWRKKRAEIPAMKKLVERVQNSGGSVKDAEEILTKEIRRLVESEHNKKTKAHSWLTNYSNVDDDWRIYYAVDLSGEGDGPPRKFGNKMIPAPSGRHWMGQDYIDELYEQNRIVWRAERAYRKLYIEESEESLKGILTFPTRQGTEFIKQLLGRGAFDKPKPMDLIKHLLTFATDKTSLVLDSFAGSGTIGHAVVALNNEDGGNRKFILVQCDEFNKKTGKIEDICDAVTAERLRRVIKGFRGASDENLRKGLGGTFSYFELGKAIELDSILDGKNLPSYLELARYVFYTATGEEFDERKVNEKRSFVGESKTHEVYLFYQPDMDYLKKTALTLERAESLGKLKTKRRLVFAPTKYLDQEQLDALRIDFAQLPFEIYKLAT